VLADPKIPCGPADWYIDPTSQQQRRVSSGNSWWPARTSPFYNQTFEIWGIFKATPVLPLRHPREHWGWAHSDEGPSTMLVQFFPVPVYGGTHPALASNLIDGR